MHAVDPDQPVFNVRDFRGYVTNGALGVPRLVMQMVGTSSLIGLTLAIVGLYGLVAYSVSCRTREIGIRIAVGATSRDVLTMVARQGLVLSTIGIVLGLSLSVPIFRLLASALAGLGSLSAWILALVPVGVLLITLAASLIPARRASRVDPTDALRA